MDNVIKGFYDSSKENFIVRILGENSEQAWKRGIGFFDEAYVRWRNIEAAKKGWEPFKHYKKSDYEWVDTPRGRAGYYIGKGADVEWVREQTNGQISI